jgi:catechol 2,3-dioxygenase-like lactoylglutathione lyase family enzyme
LFRQVVAHRWAPGTDDAERTAFRDAMESLRAIPELLALRHGDDVARFDGNHDYVTVLDFADFAAARRYVAADLHQAFVQDHAQVVVDARVVVQHEWATGRVSGLHHVKLPVTDVERSRDWYAGAFGFTCELEFREDGRLVGVGLQHPDGDLRLALREDPARAAALAGFDTVCLAVGTRADLDELLSDLDRRGIAHGIPVPGRNGDAVDVPDPDGHLVRIHTLTGHDPAAPHRHARTCFWDVERCRWQCTGPR